jgi:hypothetical protein
MESSAETKKRLLEELHEGTHRSKAFQDLLTAETPRGCALVAGAFLEQRLMELLRARMIEAATADRALDARHRLDTYSSLIKAPQAIDIVSL